MGGRGSNKSIMPVWMLSLAELRSISIHFHAYPCSFPCYDWCSSTIYWFICLYVLISCCE